MGASKASVLYIYIDYLRNKILDLTQPQSVMKIELQCFTKFSLVFLIFLIFKIFYSFFFEIIKRNIILAY